MLSPLVLISELLTIDHGKYIVKVTVQQQGVILGTGLAGADSIEKAEDSARERALSVLELVKNKFIPEINLSSPESARDFNLSETGTKLMDIDTKQRKLTKVDKESEQSIVNFSQSQVNKISPSKTITEDLGISKSSLTDIPPKTGKSISTETDIPSLFDSQPPSSEELEQGKTKKEEIKIEPLPLLEENFTVVPFPTQSLETQEKDQIGKTQETQNRVKSPRVEIPVDFSDLIAKIDLEMNRLGWTQEQGKQYLLQTYGKKSRHLLSDGELIEFIRYLENL